MWVFRAKNTPEHTECGMKNLSGGKGTDTPTGDTEALLQHRTGGKSWGQEDAECRGAYS